jgi:hypothetical protein
MRSNNLGLPKAVTLMAAYPSALKLLTVLMLESLDVMIALGWIRNRTRVPGAFRLQ